MTPQEKIEEARKCLEDLQKELNLRATNCHDLDYTYDKEREALSLALRILERCNEGFIADKIHNVLNAYTHPESYSAEEWNEFRKQIAQAIIAGLVKEE